MRVSLVPSFQQCTAPDRTHGPPLAFPSCSSPDPASPNLTVGTPEVNGAAVGFSGFVKYAVALGAPGVPDDSDLRITAGLTDVRCAGSTSACGSGNSDGGSDYTGELEVNAVARLTDRWNGTSPGGGNDAATMIDIPFPVAMDCASTPSTSTGGACALDTSANAVVPGMVKDGDRQVVELGQVRASDGGPDGQVSTAGNSLFAVQGVFVP
jgi:hypothetical protein